MTNRKNAHHEKGTPEVLGKALLGRRSRHQEELALRRYSPPAKPREEDNPLRMVDPSEIDDN